ncbi:MAG: pehX 3 [Bacteroidetes bacterium]|nr:pehX 3 [Bacteroidota bacterium]
MKINLLKCLAGTLFYLLTSSFTTPNGNYSTVKVKAPFPMQPIKVFNYPKQNFPITNYGAIEGGVADNTKAIAAAMDACNKAGGGRVVIPAGTWFTGPIHFKSNVDLHLDENAVLRFSDNPSDYLPAVQSSLEGMEFYNYSPLIYAFKCENIAITGKGTISPKMDTWKIWFPRQKYYMDAAGKLYTMMSTNVPVEERQFGNEENRMRPYLIHFNRCKNIMLDGFKIRESPFWCVHMYMCDNGIARNLDIKAHGHNNDGIDLEMTRNFLVENCIFDQGDDAVVIKSGSNQDGWRLNTPCENIVIRNCSILQGHTLLGLGSELSSGIRNIYMHNCTAPKSVLRLFYIKTNHRRGGFVENIYMENIKAGKMQRAFEIDTDVLYQWKDFPTYETRITPIHDIHMKNVTCEEVDAIYEIKGDERLPVENVELKNIHVNKVNKFIKKVSNAKNVNEKSVTYTKLAGQ